MASSFRWAVRVFSAGGSSKTSESRQPPDTTGVEGLRTTPFFGLAPDPDAERLDSDAECRKNIGEELHSHFNYERDTLLQTAWKKANAASGRSVLWGLETIN